MTPKRYTLMTVGLAVLMTVLLAEAWYYSPERWPVVMVIVAYWFGTIMTVIYQLRHSDSAKWMLRALAMPSGCMGVLAGWIGILGSHHLLAALK